VLNDVACSDGISEEKINGSLSLQTDKSQIAAASLDEVSQGRKKIDPFHFGLRNVEYPLPKGTASVKRK
jgi:hypothetical protein